MRIIGIESKMPVTLYRLALGVRFRMLNEGRKCRLSGYVSSNRETLVAGYCGMAMDAIERTLDDLGWANWGGVGCCGDFNTCKVGWMGHCWVEWREYVLDVTADQFNHQCTNIKMRPIVFCHKSKLKNIYSEL